MLPSPTAAETAASTNPRREDQRSMVPPRPAGLSFFLSAAEARFVLALHPSAATALAPAPQASVVHVSTGLPALDDRLDGGFPPGSLVALTAPPDSQSERLLYAAAAASPARYCSTFRPADEIRAVLGDRADDVPVERLRDDELLDDPGGAVDDVPEGGVVVLDTATELERAGRDRYRRALDVVKRRCRGADAVALLHCLDVEPSPMRRGLTLGRADVVVRLRHVGYPNRVDPRLFVTKNRRGPVVDEGLGVAFDPEARVES